MIDGLRLAFGTLTAVPTPAPTRVDRGTARQAMLLAPVTAVPLAVVAVLAHLVVADGALPPMVAAAVVLGLVALWSRGLHLDGLADTVDGLASGSDRDRALEVMRRGDVGPGGVTALLILLLVQFAALTTLLTTRRGVVLVVVAVLASRYVLVWGCWERTPAARPTGLGAGVARSVPTLAAAGASSVMLAVGIGLPALFAGRWYPGPLVVVAAVLATAWVLLVAVRRLGGVTGDVLGASVEVALTAALLLGSVLV